MSSTPIPTPHQCELCKTRFPDKVTLELHMLAHDRGGMYDQPEDVLAHDIGSERGLGC